MTSDIFCANHKDIQYGGNLQRNNQGRQNKKNLAKTGLKYLWQ